MSVVSTILLVAVIAIPPAISTSTETVESISLDAEKVVRLAGAASVNANLLDGERRSLVCELDRENSTECAQASLIQAVLKNLAADRRDDSAADALDAFYRIIALQQQLSFLSQSNDVLESLIKMAQRAEELDIADGDVFELQQKQLDVQDQTIVVRFGIKKLQRQLAGLIERPLAQVESASLLPTVASDLSGTDESTALALALLHRGDYLAAQTICRCMSVDTLPVAKSLLGMVQPGIGLALAKGPIAMSPSVRFAKLAHRDNSSSELACRRKQCDSFVEATRELVEQDIAQAILDRDAANERLVVALEIERSTIESTRRTASAEEIDKAPAGAQKFATLNELKRRAERVDRERDVALADVQLLRAIGTLVGDVE
jgi:hypothetical protein